MAGSSGKELTAFNILKKQDFKILAATNLVVLTFIHRIHYRMTSSGRIVRKGVGCICRMSIGGFSATKSGVTD